MLVAALLLSITAISVAADDAPKAEVFGGYSYFRCDTGAFHTACNLNGWNASAAFNAQKYLGIVADFGGAYGTVADNNLKLHTFLFGPKFAVRKEKITPFAQALFGVAHINLKEGGVSSSTNDFAMTLGFGADYKINEKISVRVAQAEYLMTLNPEDTYNHFRYSAGIVFKLGK
jgi:opacity protein-like surface antigen